jgi:hypothetical protein
VKANCNNLQVHLCSYSPVFRPIFLPFFLFFFTFPFFIRFVHTGHGKLAIGCLFAPHHPSHLWHLGG